MSIPFQTEIEFEAGRPDRLSPHIRRVIADNPGAFTFTGTGTYIIGSGAVAVIDPGPLLPAHIDAILAALDDGERVSHIFITHTHLDHSPAAAPLQKRTGAPIYAGSGKAVEKADPDLPIMEEGHDTQFRADHILTHGQIIKGDGWTLEALATPGHMSNHMCFALLEEKALFTGDHIMGWSTSIIAPPEGNMRDYMQSLELLLRRDDMIYYPTHGAPISEPKPFVEAFIAHRQAREQQVLARLAAGEHRIAQMVPTIYADTDPKLHGAAARSLLAHLEDLVARGRVACEGAVTLEAKYRLCD